MSATAGSDRDQIVAPLVSSMLQRKIGFFEGRRTQIVTLPEWPFGFSGLLAAIGSSIVPLVPSLIGFLVKEGERLVISFAP